MIVDEVKSELLSYADPVRAKHSLRFFKTGPGQYGEGDRFLGVKTPRVRLVARKYYREISLKEIKTLLNNVYHDIRMTALIMLTMKSKKADIKTRKKYFDFYLRNTRYINNWDLVDVTCVRVVGEYLLSNDRSVLYRLASSKDIWEKRIAIISTFAFIKRGDFSDSLKVAEILVNDEHDLIHKAVGWTLREVGKIDQKREEEFLRKYYKSMPRTALRYAIERFPEKLRDFYLGRSPNRK